MVAILLTTYVCYLNQDNKYKFCNSIQLWNRFDVFFTEMKTSVCTFS